MNHVLLKWTTMNSVLCKGALADAKRRPEHNKWVGLCLGWADGNNSQNYAVELSYWGSCYYVTIRRLSSPAYPRIMPTLCHSVPAKQMSVPHLLLHIIQFWIRVSHGSIWPAEQKSQTDLSLQRSLGNVVHQWSSPCGSERNHLSQATVFATESLTFTAGRDLREEMSSASRGRWTWVVQVRVKMTAA